MISSFVNKFKIHFNLCDLNSEALICEQHKSLARQLPSLYLAGITSMFSVIAVNFNTAPAWAVIYIPAPALLFSFWRFVHWIKVSRNIESYSLEKRRKDVRMVIIMSPVLTLVFTVLAIVLLFHGDLYQQTLSVLLLWATVGVAGYSMSSVPQASITSVFSSSIPLFVAFIESHDNLLTTISIGYISLSLLSIYILLNSFRAFSFLVYSRQELKEKHEKMHKLAYTDPLTGLANRRNFKEKLIKKVKQSAGTEQKFAVCILDMDGFKTINNLYNHAGGDLVLVEIGKRLEKLIGKNGLVARLSSDEFHIQAYDVTSENDAEKLGRAIHKTLREPVLVDGNRVDISTSIGISIYPESGLTPSHLVKRAVQAQNKAKRSGGGRTRIFAMRYETEILERAGLLIDLKAALERDELEVYFQPIVDLQTGRYAGFETLARWNHPERGFVPPEVFITLAEEKDLIEPLTICLLRKAAAVAATWPADIKLAFNLSAQQVCNPNFALTILAILNETGLPPHRFEAELTETAMMLDMEKALLMVSNLKQVGISISLDDFGTGYSSLSQISNLPLDKLKIDKSFVDNVSTSKKMRNIVRTIIGMCTVLKLKSVAEGIETKEQYKALKAAGGHLGQGYLFSRPLRADKIKGRFFYDPLKDAA